MDETRMPVTDRELDRFWRKLREEVDAGIKHGFFQFEVTGELIKGEKRSLTIKAGKSHHFVIPSDDLPK
jgi:hypothetical protein